MGSTNTVAPLSETSWTIPATRGRISALISSTMRPLRWVISGSCTTSARWKRRRLRSITSFRRFWVWRDSALSRASSGLA